MQLLTGTRKTADNLDRYRVESFVHQENPLATTPDYLLRCTCMGVILLGQASVAMSQVPIIQPGPPGEPVRELSAEERESLRD